MRNIGIAGFGTVGQGFFSQINKNFKNFKVIQIAVKNVKKKRKINLKNIKVTSKVQELAINPNIQVLVECIGGSSGVAYKLVKRAIENKN